MKFRKMYIIALSFVILFQCSVSFAKQIGPVIRGYYIGMPINDFEQATKKQGLKLRKFNTPKGVMYCIPLGPNFYDSRTNLYEFVFKDGDNVSSIKLPASEFVGDGVKILTSDFAEKFAEKYRLQLNYVFNGYEYTDKTNGFEINIYGGDDGCLNCVVLRKIESYDEEKEKKRKEEEMRKNTMDNIRF